MIQKMFAVYDLKAQAFLQPFFSVQAGSAIRAFGDALEDKASPLGKHPNDYQLFELGNFDDHSGELTGTRPMKLLVSGSDMVLKADLENAKAVNVEQLRDAMDVERIVSNGSKKS